ncbi:MAG: hypothetical protein ACTSR1_12580, partial [Candidatus Heimdallarchaeota archaeon]
FCRDLTVDENFIYTSGGGFRALDWTNLNNLTEVGYYFDGGSANSLIVQNKIVFLADGLDGLEILNFTYVAPLPVTTPETIITIVLANSQFVEILIALTFAFCIPVILKSKKKKN